MEQLLQYCWKHKLFPLQPLKTTTGETVEVIDTGLHNHNAGPDFFNAKVKINDTLWVGNVEIHDHASQWILHGHDRDKRYNNVILHVVRTADDVPRTQDGKTLPQVVMDVPQQVRDNYQRLLTADRYPPCHPIIPTLSRLKVHGWLTSLQTERLEHKTQLVMQYVEQCGGSWEHAFFTTLARNYGFGVNGEAFETWARHIPLHSIDHHRDDLFQIEAMFMGQAGLLDEDIIPARYRQAAMDEGYFDKLRKEYRYLAHKFSLQPMDAGMWQFLRLRPQNFPYIRLSQLAHLHFSRRASLSQIIGCATTEELQQALATQVTPYWQTHYVFGEESRKSEKRLSQASVNLLIINTVIPILFAYGRHRQKESLCDRAFSLLEQLKAEDNHIVRMWKEGGLKVENAGDSQALIQLKNEYCNKKECLRCRIGYEFLSR